jgi:hypothetical protein
MQRWILVSVLLVLSACVDQKTLFERTVPKEDDTFARKFIDLVCQGRYEQADAMMDPAFAARVGPNGLVQARHYFLDDGNPISFQTIGWNVTYVRPFDQSKPTVRNMNLDYQLHFHDSWVLVNLVLTSTGRGNHVTAVNFQPLSDSVEVLNRFTFTGKTAGQYLFFAVCVLLPIFMVTTAVICFFSRVRFRWLWIVFILLAFGQFQLDWSTGGLSFQAMALSLLGSGYWRPGLYGTYFLKFGVPIGAIFFLILRPWLRRKSVPADSEST